MSNIQTTILTTSPAISAHERITTLHTFDHHRRHKVVQSSPRSFFTDIYSSDTGVIGFLAQVSPFAGRFNSDGVVENDFQTPGLFVISTQFDPTRDWVFATEYADYGAEGKVRLIFGEDRYKDVADVIQSEVASRELNRQRAQETHKTWKSGPGLFCRLIQSVSRTESDMVALAEMDECYRAYRSPRIQRFSLMAHVVPSLPQLKELVYEV